MSEQPVPRPRFHTVMTEAAIPIEADDLLTLARHYADQGMYDESIHLYEMAEKLKPGSVSLRINLARVRHLNPLDRGLAEIAGRVEFELKNFEEALNNFVDAFLLATDQKGETTEPVRRMINTLKRILNHETKDLNARIKQRVDNLQVCTE